jgi:hypothetical protein
MVFTVLSAVVELERSLIVERVKAVTHTARRYPVPKLRKWILERHTQRASDLVLTAYYLWQAGLRAVVIDLRIAVGNSLRTSRIKLPSKGSSLGLRSAKHTMRKTIRIVGVSLALIALLVFASGVVCDWNHQGASDDVRCPYCHLGHQAPAQLMASPSASLLKPIASLPLPQDAVQATGSIFSQTSPRAPPTL